MNHNYDPKEQAETKTDAEQVAEIAEALETNVANGSEEIKATPEQDSEAGGE